MQLVWVLPSLLFGSYMALSSGSWQLLAMSIATALVAAISIKIRNFQQVDFNHPIEFFEGRFWVGDKALPRWRFFWRREWNQPFYKYFQSIETAKKSPLDFAERPEFADPGADSALLGYSNSQPLITSFVREGAHLLVIGPTGSGKSVLLRQVLGSLASGSTAQESKFGFFDFKGGATFGHISGARTLFIASDLNSQVATEALQLISSELQARELKLQAFGVDDYRSLKAMGQLLPTIYVFVDELAAMLQAAKSSSVILEAVVSKGRSLGVILIAANQSLSSIPRSLQINMRQRVGLLGIDPIDLNQLGFKHRQWSHHSAAGQGLQGCWIGSSGISQEFIFRPDFNLEKTFVNRHFSS